MQHFPSSVLETVVAVCATDHFWPIVGTDVRRNATRSVPHEWRLCGAEIDSQRNTPSKRRSLHVDTATVCNRATPVMSGAGRALD